jgi:two-component system, cell cycle sensor histidine kinase and response regulator CckA
MASASILIVEDEFVIAMDLQAMLERLGYTVLDIAVSAEEALDAIARLRPDLVLLDIRLANGSSGIAVAEELRHTSDIPFVFITAHADADTVRQAEATEPYHYLLKPFVEHTVAIAVRLALAKSASDRALRLSERRYATTLQCIADAVVVADADRHVTLLNPAASVLTGWAADEALGQPLDAVVSVRLPEGHPTLDTFVAAVQHSGLPAALPGDVLLQRRDGNVRLVTDSVAPLTNPNGTITGAVLVVQDVTERRAIEEQQRLTELRLLETQRLESLGVLAGGIAHDFNNLLAVIMGNTELALEQLSPGTETHTVLLQAFNGARRAADLTQQMLMFASRRPRRLAVVNLNDLVDDLSDLVRAAIAGRGLYTQQLAPVLPLIEADGTQIKQVILNLVTNAAEALEASGAIHLATSAVMLSAEDLSQCLPGANCLPGLYVALVVEDTGVGMDASTLQRIFDPFFTTKFTGRGLGLAVVQGIVRAHGAALEMRSTPGRGTTVRLYLPAIKTPPAGSGDSLASSVAAPEPAQQEQAAGSRGTLLIIDDDEGVRRVVARMLQQLGFQVEQTDDIPYALSLIEAGVADLRGILVDLTMPAMNGFAVTQAIKAIRSDLPIILMSGYAAEDIERNQQGLGLQCFLQKPFSRQALEAALATQLI